MDEDKKKKTIDITNMTDDELIDFYSKISENVLILNRLFDIKDMEEAIMQYQITLYCYHN